MLPRYHPIGGGCARRCATTACRLIPTPTLTPPLTLTQVRDHSLSRLGIDVGDVALVLHVQERSYSYPYPYSYSYTYTYP